MVNKIRTIDIIKWVEFQIDFCIKKNAEIKIRYAECKEEYEQRFLPKLFGWKYEDSIEGNTSWLYGRWDLNLYPTDRYKKLLVEAIYQNKIGTNHIEVNQDFHPSFYKYCQENNIPF